MTRLDVIKENLGYIQAHYPKEMIERETHQFDWLYKTGKEQYETREKLRKARFELKEVKKDCRKLRHEYNKLSMKIHDLKQTFDQMMIRYQRAYALYEKWMPWMTNEVEKAKYLKDKGINQDHPVVVTDVVCPEIRE